MPRRFLTQRDVDDLADGGCTELVVDDATTLTDLARERAGDRGIAIVRGDVPTDVAPVSSTAAVAGDPPEVTIAPEDRRRLRAEVRAAVIAQLGSAPPSLDPVIDGVLDELM